MQIFNFIYSNLDHYKKKFFAVLFVSFISATAGLAIPLLLTEFTDSNFGSTEFQNLIILIIATLISLLASQWVIRKWGEAFSYQFSNYLREKYFKMIEGLPMATLSKHHSGFILAMVSKITDQLHPIIRDIFWQFSGIIISLGFLMYFTIKESWLLAAFNLTILTIFIITSAFMAKRIAKISDELNQRGAVMTQYFVDFMGNISTIKRLGVRDFTLSRLRQKINETNSQVQVRQDYHANRWFLLHSIYFLANFTTIGILLYQISLGRQSVSILIIFLFIFYNMRSNVERLSENIVSFAEIQVYIRRLQELLSDQRKATGDVHIEKWEEINLQNISYQHSGSKHILTVPELSIRKGEKVCIFGKSGEGKTTLLNLIARFYTADGGQCSVDRQDFGNINESFFREKIAYISQDIELFNISVWDNLTLGKDIKEDQVTKLLEKLDMRAWLNSLKDGYQTIVGEKGVRLSAGQKQRLNLARGIVLDRDIYLLDEPTSSLDTATEEKIVLALKEYLHNKTVVVVTHRSAIKSICNSFYEIKDHKLKKVR